MRTCLKRALDVVAAGLLLAVLAPLLAAIAILTKLTSSGPAIFKQERVGKNEKSFTLYKFRTMRVDADPFGPSPKSGGDPRLTALGRWLREYSLDELPQLVNIVYGDMSLVGPRPLYVSQVREWNERQKKRLRVKPGLTGLAQISGRGRLTREEKLELDVRYVESASLRLDCRILLATLLRVFRRAGIYEQRYSAAERTRGSRTDRAAEEGKL
jgi:lipopolysaccharide/colanic/teichoic acid biosynthesis glycosyltransferase